MKPPSTPSSTEGAAATSTSTMKPNQVYCTKEGKRGEPSELSTTAFRHAEKLYKLVKVDASAKPAKRKMRAETDPSIDTNTDPVASFGSTLVDMRSPETSAFSSLLVELDGSSRGQRVFAFRGVPGLFLLPNAVKPEQQGMWCRRALRDFSQSRRHPNNVSTLDKERVTEGFEKKMRWATLGFSYDWTNKVYDKTALSSFPRDLHELSTKVVGACEAGCASKGSSGELPASISAEEVAASVAQPQCRAGVPPTPAELNNSFGNYDPQTAIVNFFPVGTQMMAHQDVSEDAMHRPLVSISFGCSAVFLMGTICRDDPPYAFLLRSGDACVFTGPSREAYHGVPRVFSDCPSWLCGSPGESADEAKESDLNDDERALMKDMRININVRQVYDDPLPEEIAAALVAEPSE